MMLSIRFHQYKTAIRALPDRRPFTKDDLLVDVFVMERRGRVEIFYAPHNEVVNLTAEVAIVGITPGWTQMNIAYQAAKNLD